MKLPEETLKVLSVSANTVGNYEKEMFNQNLYHECFDMDIDSPIEQILYIAIDAVRHVAQINRMSPQEINGERYVFGLDVIPQKHVGRYRVDFQIIHYGLFNKDGTQIINKILVECDSQAFHERTEKERRYEKARDRSLNKAGFTVFHYTGKEIIEDPYKIAAEIISEIIDDDADDLCRDFNNYRTGINGT